MAGITVEFDVRVPMRDGITLSADVFRPEGDGPHPVLVARTPYGKSELGELFYLDPWAAARRGFIVVLQDVRGRGLSEGGEWTPLAGEALDGYDTIEWAAGVSGSNGRVGMWGASYLGNVQLQAALLRPPSLKAIVPMFTWNSPWDGLVARGGVQELGLRRPWSLYMAFESAMRMHAEDEEVLAARMRDLIAAVDAIPGPTNDALPTAPDAIIGVMHLPDLGHPDATKASDMQGKLGALDVPSLHVGGWFDIFLQGTLDNFIETVNRQGARLVVGPWNHQHYRAQQGERNFGFSGNHFAIEYRTTLFGLIFDWLHDHLGGVPVSAAEPRAMVYMMGANEWLRESSWPPADTVDVHWHLAPNGALTQEEPGSERVSLVHRPFSPVPTRGGATLLEHLPAGSYEQGEIETRDDVLVFLSEPLTTQLDVVGRVSATLQVSSDASSADWVVRLCDVHPDGSSFNVTDGVIRAAGQPGVPVQVQVDLWSTAMSFKPGHRLGVQVTASCFPRWERNMNTSLGGGGSDPTATQTLHIGASDCFLSLPVRTRATG